MALIMARLHEYQGKAILAANGFKIPRGRAASVVNIKKIAQESSLGFHQACKHAEARRP